MRTRTTAPVVIAAALAVSLDAQRAPLTSGFDPSMFDARVRPQDDLYRYVNGRWLAQTDIPDDRVSYSAAAELIEKSHLDVRAILDDMRTRDDRRRGSPWQQVLDLYDSMVDVDGIEQRGISPLAPTLDAIAAINSVSALARVAGELSATTTAGPFFGTLGTHPRDRRMPAVYLGQGGLLLDREHYLSNSEASVTIRREYEAYLTRIFTLTGRATPERDAASVLAVEIELARAHLPVGGWTPSAPLRVGELNAEFPGFDWDEWAEPQGIERVGIVVVLQPSFFKAFGELVKARPMSVWRAWLSARYITALAPFVTNALGDARFDFFGLVVSGQERPIPRWKRAISLVNAAVGDTVGREYAARHLPRPARDRARRLVESVIRAYEEAIEEAQWLSPAARSRARDRISSLAAHVGYPDVWRSYGGLEIHADDLLGNVIRSQQFENERRMAGPRRSGGGDWPVSPQIVNAFYVAARNEIILPAAMLQPPYFDAAADDAMNYGALGAVVGHEIGHALTQDGWNEADRTAYVAQAQILLDQLNGIRLPESPDYRLNGMRVLVETIGDLSGLSVAWRAWQRSLDGRPSPVLDGFTGEQRFFMAWARIWRSKERPEYARQILLASRHPPSGFRANATAGHVEAFYRAFTVRAGDALFIPPGRRARLF